MLVFKDSFSKKLLQIIGNAIKTGVNYTESTDMPQNPSLNHVWRFIDPTTNKPVGIRVYLPFTEILSGFSNMNKSIVRDMPDIECWFTAAYEPNSQNTKHYEESVPEFDENFIPDRRHVLRLLNLISKPVTPGSGRGYYGFGEAGIGKTSTALWLFSVLRIAVVHMNCKRDMVGEEFFLFQTANEGKWEQTYGPMLRAVLHNWPIIVDEMDLGPDSFWPSINNLIEGHKYAVPGFKDFHIKAGTNFRLIGFGNTGPGREIGKYKGRSSIDGSFFDRMIKDYYDTLTASQFEAILKSRFKDVIDAEMLKRLSKFAVSINNSVLNREFPEMLSPRSLIAICKDYVDYEKFTANPFMCAISNALGSTLRDSATLMQLLNTYAAEICDNAIEINELEKIWRTKDSAKAPPMRKSRKSAANGNTDVNNDSETESKEVA